MLRGCFAAAGTGVIQKLSIIMRKDYVHILKQHLKTSGRKLKLECEWAFQMDIHLKNTSTLVVKWLEDSKGLWVAIKKPQHIKLLWRHWKGNWEQAYLQTWLSLTSSVWRNGPKYIKILWKKLMEGCPKRLSQVKHNSTKHRPSICQPLTLQKVGGGWGAFCEQYANILAQLWLKIPRKLKDI